MTEPVPSLTAGLDGPIREDFQDMKTLLIGLDPDSVPEAYLARVRDLAPDMNVLVTEDPEKIEAVLDDIEIAAAGMPREMMVQSAQPALVPELGRRRRLAAAPARRR